MSLRDHTTSCIHEFILHAPTASRRWRNFGHCRSLRSLTFPVSPYSTLATGYHNLFDALTHAPRSMNQITLELHTRHVHDVSIENQLRVWDDRMGWRLLKDTLSQFEDLGTLRFVVKYTAGATDTHLELFRSEVEKLVALRLPDIYRTGKICVETSRRETLH